MTALFRNAAALALIALGGTSTNQQTQIPSQEAPSVGTAFILGRTIDGTTANPSAARF